MNYPRSFSCFVLRTLGLSLALFVAGRAVAQTVPAVTPPAKTDEVVELSPFVVATAQDTGYQATSTLAGTRLNTSLKDIGAAVSVYTPEFLADINASKLEDILTYTMSTEVGGPNGNMSGVTGESSAAVREDPAAANRVRALATATRTRDFFASDIPSDGFSFDSLTISRGPNAILAGVGSAGGVIDAALRKPTFKDNYRFVSRFSDYGSHREEMHFNKVIIPKRLAARLDLLNDDTYFRQKPAFSKDQRIYSALNYVMLDPKRGSFLGRGTFRANYENGKIAGTPPDPLTPTFSVSNWFNAINPKWAYNGATQQTLNAAGQVVTGTAAQTGIIPGFPLFNQIALIYSDPNSGTANVGIPAVGTSSPNLSTVQGFQGTIAAALPGSPGGALRDTGDPNRLRVGYVRSRLIDPQIFDFYDHLLTGIFDQRDQRFNASDFRYEQLLMGGNAGFELAYNKQTFTTHRNFPIPTGGNDEGIMIDVNKVLSVRSPEYPNGIPNPNFGRPFVSTTDVFRDNINRTGRESYQMTAFFKHDFTKKNSWFGSLLGRHDLSALLFQTKIDRMSHRFGSTWDATNTVSGALNPLSVLTVGPGLFGTQVNGWFYLGPSAVNANSVSDIRLQPITAGIPQYGQTYTLQVYDPVQRKFVTTTSKPQRILAGINDQKEDLKSTAFGLQSHWLKDHIVTVVGWREDHDETVSAATPARLADGNLDIAHEVYLPAVTEGKRSWTKSVVGVLPFKLPGETEVRAFWNESGNFNPVGVRRNIWNEELGSPTANTREYGASVSMLNGKFNLRVTQFKTTIKKDAVSIGSQTTYSYISTVITNLLAARDAGLSPSAFGYNNSAWNSFGDVAQAVYDTIPTRLKNNIGPSKNFNPHFTGSGATVQWVPDSIQNYTSTSDTQSTGTEYEAIVNPTPNWRISLSVAKNQAVKANAGAEELAFAAAWKKNLDTMFGGALLSGQRQPTAGILGTFWDQYNSESLVPVRAAAALSGTATPEIRKWRANLVTRYDFRGEFLRGVNIGAAFRWQDKVGIGYPLILNADKQQVSDIMHPYWGPTEAAIDLSVGYRRKLQIRGAPIDWSIGLNVRNLNAYDRVIPIAANADGSYGTFRIPPERQWSVTNSFSF